MTRNPRLYALLLLLDVGVCQAVGSRSIQRYMSRGDAYMKAYQFDLAAHAYKMALMHEPESREAWDRHREAVETPRIISRYMTQAEAMKREGRYEEAADYLRKAAKMNPRNRRIWEKYEETIAQNPSTVYIQSEQDAWDAYREAKVRFEEADYHSAQRLLERVFGFTEDPTLRYYAKSYLQKVQLKIKEKRPSTRLLVTDK